MPKTQCRLQVMLDSEGIETNAQSDQYMAQLFSMCILFSSLFVYNHKGFLEARAFKELSLVATILEEINAGVSCPDMLKLKKLCSRFIPLNVICTLIGH